MRAIYKYLDHFDKAELERLAGDQEGLCVSLFLPIHTVAGHETQADALRLRKLIDQAERALATRAMTPAAIEQLLAPVATLAEPNREFWGAQRKGLAIFVAQDHLLVYRLPLPLPELVTVDRRFCLLPLLPLIDGEDHFYLLALSQNAIRFFQGTRYQVEEVELTDTPTSLADALRYDEAERSLQLHSATNGAAYGRRPAIFHGQGVPGDEKIVHNNLLRFFHMVEREVTARLTRERAPLVLAGVEADQGLYRQVNHYPYLMDHGIAGNPDRLAKEALHAAAWAIVASYFQAAQERAYTRYAQLAGRADGHTVTDIKNVVLAAVYHQVETLFVLPSPPIWGKYVPEGHQVVVHKAAEAEDEELVNLAVVHTLHNHGAAYLVKQNELPDVTALAAILRH